MCVPEMGLQFQTLFMNVICLFNSIFYLFPEQYFPDLSGGISLLGPGPPTCPGVLSTSPAEVFSSGVLGAGEACLLGWGLGEIQVGQALLACCW